MCMIYSLSFLVCKHADSLESELSRKLEIGRLVHLLCKLALSTNNLSKYLAIYLTPRPTETYSHN